MHHKTEQNKTKQYVYNKNIFRIGLKTKNNCDCLANKKNAMRKKQQQTNIQIQQHMQTKKSDLNCQLANGLKKCEMIFDHTIPLSKYIDRLRIDLKKKVKRVPFILEVNFLLYTVCGFADFFSQFFSFFYIFRISLSFFILYFCLFTGWLFIIAHLVN